VVKKSRKICDSFFLYRLLYGTEKTVARDSDLCTIVRMAVNFESDYVISCMDVRIKRILKKIPECDMEHSKFRQHSSFILELVDVVTEKQ
jgi:hypothetical protein